MKQIKGVGVGKIEKVVSPIKPLEADFIEL